MAVFIIQSTEFFADGRRRHLYVEAAQHDLAAFAVDLRSGPVLVQQLFAKRNDTEFIVNARRDLMITHAMIHHAYNPDLPFVEYEDGSAPQ